MAHRREHDVVNWNSEAWLEVIVILPSVVRNENKNKREEGRRIVARDARQEEIYFVQREEIVRGGANEHEENAMSEISMGE